MRAELIDLEPRTVAHPRGGIPGQYFRVTARDIDAPKNEKQAYIFDIDGDQYKDHRPKDRLSIFGHEEINATHLSTPRFFYNHETTVYGPAYQTHFIDRNFFPISDFMATVAGSAHDKKQKFFGGVASAIGLLPEEVNQRFVKGGFDMLPLYKAISVSIHDFIKLEPDDKFKCVNPRPEFFYKGGSLVE